MNRKISLSRKSLITIVINNPQLTTKSLKITTIKNLNLMRLKQKKSKKLKSKLKLQLKLRFKLRKAQTIIKNKNKFLQRQITTNRSLKNRILINLQFLILARTLIQTDQLLCFKSLRIHKSNIMITDKA